MNLTRYVGRFVACYIALHCCVTFGGDGSLLVGDGVPAALAALDTSQVLSHQEASEIRGQALTAALIEARAADVVLRATVEELPGGVYYFAGRFFGDGFLLDPETGRGAILATSSSSPVREAVLSRLFEILSVERSEYYGTQFLSRSR